MSSTSTPKRKNSSLSCGGDGGKKPKRSRLLLPMEEADQRGNAEGGEGTPKEGSRSLLSGDNGGGGEVALKKGPWTREEDEILVDHIKKYGEGKWKAVQKNSGLARDGKSCRLRWSNHLRSGLKRGAFTAEEKHKILEFHFLKGSKWTQMAALLPGRTDNEIKNFWNARYRKRQRAGLPIYPNEITSKYSFNGSQESADTLANEPSQHDETENFNLDITDLDLKYFKFHPDMLPSYFDTQDYKPISDLVGRCSDSSHNTLPMHRAAVVRRRYLNSSSSAAVLEVFDQYGKYPILSTPCDPILNTCLLHGYDNPITGFHAASNISSSEPIYGSMSFELPSFQNSQTQQCTWSGMYVPPLTSFESADTLVHAPLIEPCPSVPVSSDCSHLIDSSVYYNSDQNLQGASIDSLQANTDSTAPNEADISTQWNGSNFLRWTRPEIETTQNYDIYGGAFNDQLPAYCSFGEEDNLNQKELALPDAVLDSGWH
ncbi:transcription factor GAMYB-like [Vicia villosa]|uniref:transcription factor GAMYB-like n=1 Tax=Vicia villosa TaxID=3911 RepID=UPI00273AC0E0|nr:transcription factor GAMYB-like [Vicia villosa]